MLKLLSKLLKGAPPYDRIHTEVDVLRIVECTDTFLPIVDGVGRVVHKYAEALSRRGHEVYVITPIQDTGYRGSFPFEIVDFLSVKVIVAQQYRMGVAPLDPHYAERMAALKPDLVHVHSPAFAGVEGYRLSEKHRVPLIGTFHSKYYDDIRGATHSDVISALGVKVVANFYEKCDYVWTVSENAAETLRFYGYTGDIDIVHNGSDIRTPDPAAERAAREAFGLDERPMLLYVGQMDVKKNLPLVIEAAGLLKRRGRDFRLVMAGQGKDLEELKSRTDELGLDAIFTGHISDAALLDGLYMAADLFVFPSLYDTAGLVVGEAAVMGTPSVVTKGSAPSEFITPNETGLVAYDSAESLASSIDGFIFGASLEERRAMAARAAASIPLPWDRVIEQVETRYMNAVSAHADRLK